MNGIHQSKDNLLLLNLVSILLINLTGCNGCQQQGGKNERTAISESTSTSAAIETQQTSTTGQIKIDSAPQSAEKTYGLDQTLPVAGFATSSVNGVDAKTAGTIAISVSLRGDLPNSSELLDSDSCSSGTYTAKLIGSGYEIVKAEVYSGSKFELAKAPIKNEVLLELSCGQRCLVQAGQRGVICNQIADSVLAAFEIALGKNLYDQSFAGAKIAKIAASIVDASQLKGDETDAFKQAILDCSSSVNQTSKADCYRTAIKNSPFYPAFKIMEQLSVGWTPEGLYSFVTSVLGASVEVDSELYGWIMDSLEKALNTTFITDTRNLLVDVVKSQNANEGKYPFQVVCSLQIASNTSKFKPGLNENQISCDKSQAIAILSAAGIPSQYHDPILNNQQRDGVPCTVDNAPTTPDGKKLCWARMSMVIESAVQETDRNDATGLKRTQPTRNVSMVDVMPQVMMAIMDAKLPIGDGPIGPMTDQQKQKLQEILAAKKEYFLGLVGVYRILNDPDLRNVKLSLNDLHEIFVDKRFLNSRIVAWGPGFTGVQYSTTNGDRSLSPLLKNHSSLKGVMTVDDLFRFNPQQSFQQPKITADQLSSLLNDSTLNFEQTFGMFLKIPNSREIERFIFDMSRHEEWNPIGSRYLNVAQLRNSNKPISCKILKPGPNFTFTSATSIECDSEATNVTCGAVEEGLCSFPADYSFPFILMDRGWFGEDQGRLYGLASRTNGRSVGGNDRDGVMIREVKAGNAQGECDSGQIGKVVQYIAKFQCGDNAKCNQNVTAYCMDMDALGMPARKRFYPAGFYEVTLTNFNTGETNIWKAPRIGVYSPGTDHVSDSSACLYVTAGTYVSTSSTSTNLATLNVDVSGNLKIKSVRGAAIKDCATVADSGVEKYLLFQWRDFDGAETPYAFLLNSHNETMSWTQTPVTDGNWERNNARVTQTEIEAILEGKTVAGSPQKNINGMRYINPAHDPKFDPYCDDTNGNGYCDCYPLDNLSADGLTASFGTTIRENPQDCGLRDKAAEPTISQLPYCETCQNGAKSAEFFAKFGGKSAGGLAEANSFFPPGSPPQFDINGSSFCLYQFAGETRNRTPRWVNFADLGGNHEGCPESAGATNTTTNRGPIRIVNPKSMNNAFLIPKPRQMLQLMNYALKSTGQGVTIDPAARIFSLDEAFAILQMRTLLPPKIDRLVDSTGKSIGGLSPNFESQSSGDDGNDGPITSAMKGVLLKAGRFTDADLQIKKPQNNK